MSSPNGSSEGRGCWRAGSARYRRPVWGVVSIELAVEDRPHRATAERADIDRPGAGSVQTRGAKRSHQADNAETSAEALLRVWSMLKDLLAQGGGRRTNTGGILANASNRRSGGDWKVCAPAR
jgi:hypothetical protein